MKTTSAKEAGSRAPARRAGPSKARGGGGGTTAPANGKSSRRKERTEPTGASTEAERYPVAEGRFYDVAELLADPRNARTHNRRNLDVIKASLRRHGQRKNLVVTADGEVKAGNGTLAAAMELGWTKLWGGPAPKKEEEARHYAIVDNRSAELAEWDAEVLGSEIEYFSDLPEYGAAGLEEMGFSSSEVEGYVRREQIDGADEVPEPPADPVTRMGDAWVLGAHRLVCGDAGDAAAYDRLLGGERAQMLWTDPPYGVEIVGGKHSLPPEERLRRGGKTIQNDELSPEKLREFLRSTLGAAVARTSPGGAVYVASTSSGVFLEFAAVLGREGLDVWRHTLAWVKDSFVMGRTDYHYRHESIFYGWVPGAGHYFVDDRTQDSVHEVPRPSASEEHPTMKPVELVARHVRNSSKPGWLVLDPFAGSGTTLVACEQEGRRARLIELSPAYCDVIVERWQRVTGGKAKRERRGRAA